VADLLGPLAESDPSRRQLAYFCLPPPYRATGLWRAMSSPDQMVRTSDVELFSHDRGGIPGSAQKVLRPRISIIRRGSVCISRSEPTPRAALPRANLGYTQLA
jgi:hypothetical protein